MLVVGAVAGGAVGAGGGLSVPVEACGEGAGADFGCTGRGFAAGFAVTAGTGATRVGAGDATREGASRWCGAFRIAGA